MKYPINKNIFGSQLPQFYLSFYWIEKSLLTNSKIYFRNTANKTLTIALFEANRVNPPLYRQYS